MNTDLSRNKRLDGLRGLAAIMVAASHSFYIFQIDGVRNIYDQTIFTIHGVEAFITRLFLIFANGDAGVIIFFLISGYLLRSSLHKCTSIIQSIVKFYIRRVLRLYPVFFIVILMSVLLYMVGVRDVQCSYCTTWFNNWFSMRLQTHEVLSNLLFFSTSLSGVTWTLKVQWWVSIIFPFLFLFKQTCLSRIFFPILLFTLALLYPNIQIVAYLYVFYVGSLLHYATSNIFKNYLIIFEPVSVILLLVSPEVLPYPWSQYMQVMSGSYILHQCLRNEAISVTRFFELNFFQKMGDISYAFFLMHFLVLYTLGWMVVQLRLSDVIIKYPTFFHIALFGVSFVCCYPISVMLRRLIEEPFIRYAKSIYLFF